MDGDDFIVARSLDGGPALVPATWAAELLERIAELEAQVARLKGLPVEYVLGNVFVREMRFVKAGEVVEGHKHNFDHVTYVAHGALRIEKLREDGSVERAVDKRASDGHNYVLIKAGVCHRITALEDGSLGHCIYAHRNPQGDVVTEYDGWTRGYV